MDKRSATMMVAMVIGMGLLTAVPSASAAPERPPCIKEHPSGTVVFCVQECPDDGDQGAVVTVYGSEHEVCLTADSNSPGDVDVSFEPCSYPDLGVGEGSATVYVDGSEVATVTVDACCEYDSWSGNYKCSADPVQVDT